MAFEGRSLTPGTVPRPAGGLLVARGGGNSGTLYQNLLRQQIEAGRHRENAARMGFTTVRWPVVMEGIGGKIVATQPQMFPVRFAEEPTITVSFVFQSKVAADFLPDLTAGVYQWEMEKIAGTRDEVTGKEQVSSYTGMVPWVKASMGDVERRLERLRAEADMATPGSAAHNDLLAQIAELETRIAAFKMELDVHFSLNGVALKDVHRGDVLDPLSMGGRPRGVNW